jgi:hypothetical protein
VLNRLVYDSNYVDFIKELSRFENCSSIVNVIDSLKYYRRTPELDAVLQQGPIIPKEEVADDEKEPLLDLQKVTQDELAELAAKHYPGNADRGEPEEEPEEEEIFR